jgi:hypothetical protein
MSSARCSTPVTRNELVEQQLRLLGEEVVRVAQRFAREPALHRQVECDDAADRVIGARG